MFLWKDLPTMRRRRFSLRTFVISLAAIYFVGMYIFHSDLSGTGSVPRRERLGVGERSFDDAPQDLREKLAKHRVNLPQVWESIQQLELKKKGRKNLEPVKEEVEEELPQEPFFQFSEELDAAYWNLTNSVKYNQDQWNEYTEQMSNIPSGCGTEGIKDEGSFTPVSPGIYLYSAYWDARPNDFDNKNGGVFIRIMAVIHKKIKPSLSCVFPSALPSGRDGWDKSSDRVRIPVSFYEMCENHNRAHGGFILSCPVPDFMYAPPCAVNVSSRTATVSLGIRTLKPLPKRRKFTICVPPLFGNIPLGRLVEFLEMSSVLGANHIMFYTYNLSANIGALLEDYATRTNRVTLVPWHLNKQIDSSIWYHGQIVSIQDCLYRNMATSEFVVFSDIDEYILPRTVSYWKDMIKLVDKPDRCAFQYQSAFFKPIASNSSVIKEVGLTLHTQTALVRTTSFSKMRAKCLVKPFLIFEKGIHHVSKPILAKLNVHQVDTKVGFLNHYRPCTRTMAMNCDKLSADNAMLQYREQLLKRLLVVRKEVLKL